MANRFRRNRDDDDDRRAPPPQRSSRTGRSREDETDRGGRFSRQGRDDDKKYPSSKRPSAGRRPSPSRSRGAAGKDDDQDKKGGLLSRRRSKSKGKDQGDKDTGSLARRRPFLGGPADDEDERGRPGSFGSRRSPSRPQTGPLGSPTRSPIGARDRDADSDVGGRPSPFGSPSRSQPGGFGDRPGSTRSPIGGRGRDDDEAGGRPGSFGSPRRSRPGALGDRPGSSRSQPDTFGSRSRSPLGTRDRDDDDDDVGGRPSPFGSPSRSRPGSTRDQPPRSASRPSPFGDRSGSTRSPIGGDRPGSTRPPIGGRTSDRDRPGAPARPSGRPFGAPSDRGKDIEKKDEKRGSRLPFRRSKSKGDDKGKKPGEDRARPSGTPRRSSRQAGATGTLGARATGAAALGTAAAPRRQSRKDEPAARTPSRRSSKSRTSARPGRAEPAKSTRTSLGRQSTTATRSRAKSKAKPLPQVERKGALSVHQGLDFDRKIDLVGIILVAFALVSFFGVIPSMSFGALPPAQGGITGTLNDGFSTLFGWGKIAVPLGAFAIGIWLMMQSFDATGFELDYFRLMGILALFACALAWVQMIQLVNDTASSVAEFRPISEALAVDQGEGGGWFGHQIYVFLLAQLGDWGTLSVLIAWLIVGLMLTFDVSVVELGTFVVGILAFLPLGRGNREQKRAAREAAKAGKVQVTRPGEKPQQMPLEAAAVGAVAGAAVTAAATATPVTKSDDSAPDRSSRFRRSKTKTETRPPTPEKTPDEPPVRPAPVIRRRGGQESSATDEMAAPVAEETTSLPAGELLPDQENRQLSRRRLPHMRGSEPSSTESAPEEDKPDTASKTDVSAEDQAESRGLFRRSKSRGPGETTAESKPDTASEAGAPAPTGPDADSESGGRRGLFRRRSKSAPVDGTAGDQAAAGDVAADQPPEKTSPFARPRVEKTDADAPSRRLPDIPVPPRDRPPTSSDVPGPDRPETPARMPLAGSRARELDAESPGAPGAAARGPFTGTRRGFRAPGEPDADTGDHNGIDSVTPGTDAASKLPDIPADDPSPPVRDRVRALGLPSRPEGRPARRSPFGRPAADADSQPDTGSAGPLERLAVEPDDITAREIAPDDTPARPAGLSGLERRRSPLRQRPSSSGSPRTLPGVAAEAESPQAEEDASDGEPESPVRSRPRFERRLPGDQAPASPPDRPTASPPAASESEPDAEASPGPVMERPSRQSRPRLPERESPPVIRRQAEPEAEQALPARPVRPTPPRRSPEIPTRAAAQGQGAQGRAGKFELPDWRRLLKKGDEQHINDEILLDKARVIEETLNAFGAPGKVVEVNPGPVITQFGIEPDYLVSRSGKKMRVKVGAIARLDADLALALAARSIRIEAPVPGKGFVGIEVPNDEVTLVGLYDIMDSPEFRRIDSKLRIALGLSVDGSPVSADLTAMPHLLIAGTTGSGKSVCINSVISCLLLLNTPEDLQFIMVDPKRVELTGYNGIPHLVAPVVVDLERIVGVLQWIQREMEERYRKFAAIAARNILDYNGKIGPNEHKMPYYVVVVDELADLMMLAPDETERLLTRLAQMARATGIHLIISTQRPSVDIITGLIKANFPARIAFAVVSSVDSRVILDQPGAEKLLGRGDMLFQSPDAAAPLRMQGVFVSDDEINQITSYWKGLALDQADATGSRAVLASPRRDIAFETAPPPVSAPPAPLPDQKREPAQHAFWDDTGQVQAAAASKDGDGTGQDELYYEAVELVQRLQKASISLLQRRLRIGYTRAARLIDMMEADGIVGPAESGSKPREVLKPAGGD